MHGWGAATYNWNCGSEFYDTTGCDGESEYAVNNMPDSVEMIYSDIGDEVCPHVPNQCKLLITTIAGVHGRKTDQLCWR